MPGTLVSRIGQSLGDWTQRLIASLLLNPESSGFPVSPHGWKLTQAGFPIWCPD